MTDTNVPLRIAPSLLAADFSRLAEDVARIENYSDSLHLDVMDGHFVPNITFGPAVVAAMGRTTKLPLDVHLMIERPETYVADFAAAGAEVLTVHVEACPHLHRTLQLIKQHGCRAGVALNPHTPLDMVAHVLADIDLLLLMTVNPGFGGQQFIPAVVPKIEAATKMLEAAGRRQHVDVQVDGGINPETARTVVAAGANVLVAGSAVFGADDPVAAVDALRQTAAVM